MNSTYTRTGRWSHEDAVENVEKSEQRIFHAIFLDASKQWAIDELTVSWRAETPGGRARTDLFRGSTGEGG